jgi:sugar lactone lactonase YvrE
MTVVAVDPRLAHLFDLDAQAAPIATGYTFTEGPVWNHRGRSLVFVDIDFGNPQGGTLYRWTEADGVALVRQPSQNSNGNTYDRQGRLITCIGGGRRVVRTGADGSIETLVSSYAGQPLNAPNDVIGTPAGDIIFTDPVIRRPETPPTTARSAVYRIAARDGALSLLFLLVRAGNAADDAEQDERGNYERRPFHKPRSSPEAPPYSRDPLSLSYLALHAANLD